MFLQSRIKRDISLNIRHVLTSKNKYRLYQVDASDEKKNYINFSIVWTEEEFDQVVTNGIYHRIPEERTRYRTHVSFAFYGDLAEKAIKYLYKGFMISNINEKIINSYPKILQKSDILKSPLPSGHEWNSQFSFQAIYEYSFSTEDIEELKSLSVDHETGEIFDNKNNNYLIKFFAD